MIETELRCQSADSTDPAIPAAVEASGVEHVYRSRGDGAAVPAIGQINLRIATGELVALLGPSGCGKSTLLRILSGLIPPTSGQVRLCDAPPAVARASRGIGWLAQDDGLLPWMTVAENVGLAGRVGQRRDAVRPGAVGTMLDRVGLSDSAGRYPHELSGGMRQRAALARALLSDPELLFLDEPFASLDELTRERLGDLLLEVRAAHRPTTLLVTHSVIEAVRLADRVLVFSPRPGRIIADVTIHLERPRRYDQAGFGSLVQSLKSNLAASATRVNGRP